ncbi:MAG: hypothetical protein AAGL34_16920 [Bacteroidota bacterium]
MKNFSLTPSFTKLIWFLMVPLLLSSCTKDYIGDVADKATVETLVADFPANDGLSLDRRGNIFASNFQNFQGTQIYKTNPKTGEFEVAVDGLAAPTGNALDRQGNIFAVNAVRLVSQEPFVTEGDVVKISKDGTRTLLATLPGFPSGLALDSHGNAFISNFDFPGVHKITPDGEVTLIAEDERLRGGVGIDFDHKGNLYVGNFNTGEIVKIARNGEISVLATIPTVVQNFVIGYITYFGGSLFATAAGEGVIYRVTLDGEATVFAGNGVKARVDGALTEASFDIPNGITGDALRKVLYVTDFSIDGSSSLRAIRLK